MKRLIVKCGIVSDALGRLNKSRRTAKATVMHRQFNSGMLEAVRPLLVKAVSVGELTISECGRLETQINKSIQNPFFQLDREYLNFIIGKLKAGRRQRQGTIS
jgi:hypothetical protein